MVGEWAWWLWALYAAGVVYFALFVASFFRFRKLEQAVREEGTLEALRAFNKGIRGVPFAFYAKMLGYAQRPEGAGAQRPAGGAGSDGMGRPPEVPVEEGLPVVHQKR